jgi:peptidylprolyl isomerase domain and WD repeat-containing protein 1
VNVHTGRLVSLMGKSENTERFLAITLYQGHPTEMGVSAEAALGTDAIKAGVRLAGRARRLATLLAHRRSRPPAQDSAVDTKRYEEDPTIFACAYKKDRFYLFSRREPEDPDRCAAPCAHAAAQPSAHRGARVP